jgi:hypothetical protein
MSKLSRYLAQECSVSIFDRIANPCLAIGIVSALEAMAYSFAMGIVSHDPWSVYTIVHWVIACVSIICWVTLDRCSYAAMINRMHRKSSVVFTRDRYVGIIVDSIGAAIMYLLAMSMVELIVLCYTDNAIHSSLSVWYLVVSFVVFALAIMIDAICLSEIRGE